MGNKMSTERRQAMTANHASCAGKVVRYVVLPLVIVAVVANIKDVSRYVKLLAM